MDDILECLDEILADTRLDAKEFEQFLNECGYMIVPIEDPTNLRYGVDE